MTPEFDRQFNQTMNQSWQRSMSRREMEYNILKLIEQGKLTFPQIGERYGVSSRTISRIAAKHGIKGSTKPKSNKSLYNLVKPVKPIDRSGEYRFVFPGGKTISFKDVPKLLNKTKNPTPKTEGVDRVNVIKSRTDELAKSFISKGMKPEEAIKIAAIQAEKEYYKKLDDLKKDQQGHIAIQNVKNTKFPPRYKKIDGKKYKL